MWNKHRLLLYSLLGFAKILPPRHRPPSKKLPELSCWQCFLIFAPFDSRFNFASKKMRKKCENQGFWPPKTHLKPTQNPAKIDVPKNIRFFGDFCLIYGACCKSQHQKNVRPASVLLACHIFHFTAFRIHFWSKKPTKNPSKTRSEPFQNRRQKHVVF